MAIPRGITCRRCEFKITNKINMISRSEDMIICDHVDMRGKTIADAIIYNVDSQPEWCPKREETVNESSVEKFLSKLDEQELLNLQKETVKHLSKKVEVCIECGNDSSHPDTCPLVTSKKKGGVWSEHCSWIKFFRPDHVRVTRADVFSWTCPACNSNNTHSGYETDLTMIDRVVCGTCNMVFKPVGG